MNRAEIVDLLSYVAACDQRTVGEMDVLAWHDQLAPIDFQTALAAARMHHRRQPDVRLRPGHLWHLCRTQTEAEAAERDLLQPCEHGFLCGACSAVHHPAEACSLLVRNGDLEAGVKALADRFGGLKALPAPVEPAADVDQLLAEAERRAAEREAS